MTPTYRYHKVVKTTESKFGISSEQNSFFYLPFPLTEEDLEFDAEITKKTNTVFDGDKVEVFYSIDCDGKKIADFIF